MRAVSTRALRASALALAGAGVLVGAIGWMHTHAGRVLLARLGVPCPVNSVDPRLVLAIRNDAAASARGTRPAPERPALGLLLDRSTKAEVAAWATRSHASCDAIVRGFEYLRCRGVAAASLGLHGPDISELWFSFNPGGALVAINLYRRDMTEPQALQSWQAAVQPLRSALGPPSTASGDQTLATLVHQPVAVARVQYTYSDYVAAVTASHLPYGGLAVREQYLSTVAPPA